MTEESKDENMEEEKVVNPENEEMGGKDRREELEEKMREFQKDLDA